MKVTVISQKLRHVSDDAIDDVVSYGENKPCFFSQRNELIR